MEEQTNHREIIIKAIKREDHPKVGPKIGILDREGSWFNSLKKAWKVSTTWDELCSLREGDRVDMYYEVRSYDKQDGSTGHSNNIVRFEKVLRPQDEVKPIIPGSVSAGTSKDSSLTSSSPIQEWSPKQTCLKSATDLLVARIGSGYEIIDLEAEVLRVATKLYKTLREPW